MFGILDDPNVRWVLAGTTLLGVSAGLLGCFAFLRRRSLLGDAIAHAALPGICVAFLVTQTRSLGPLLVGALIAGLIGAFVIQVIIKRTKLKEDAALGIVLSVFFAIGIVLLTIIQHSGAGNQSGLDKYLFGQAASLVGSDVRLMAICAALVVVLALLFFKEFKLLCFDSGFAAGIGFRPGLLDGILMTLIVLAVVVGMQAMGVILMSAMLIIPAASARFWTERLGTMIVLAATFGALSGAGGTFLSTLAFRMPTGPLIVVTSSVFFTVSLLAAPRKGLIAKAYRLIATRGRVQRENVLRSLYEELEETGPGTRTVTIASVAGRRGMNESTLRSTLERLLREGLVVREPDGYRLTDGGLEAAHGVVRNHRLWEMFLMYEGQLGADHVDRDADTIEHFLPRETVGELERFLEIHGLEPRLLPNVHAERGVV